MCTKVKCVAHGRPAHIRNRYVLRLQELPSKRGGLSNNLPTPKIKEEQQDCPHRASEVLGRRRCARRPDFLARWGERDKNIALMWQSSRVPRCHALGQQPSRPRDGVEQWGEAALRPTPCLPPHRSFVRVAVPRLMRDAARLNCDNPSQPSIGARVFAVRDRGCVPHPRSLTARHGYRLRATGRVESRRDLAAGLPR